MSPIPEATRKQLMSACEQFDRGLRDTPSWRGWEARLSQRYAIEEQGKRYPVKKIISLATGLPVSDFSGGTDSNTYIRDRGFTVVSLRGEPDVDTAVSAPLREGLQRLLKNYLRAKEAEAFGTSSSIWTVFQELQTTLAASDVLKNHPNVKVIWSVGKGNWARVPWVAFLDRRITESTTKGVYCVWLFREDMTGLYATFNQGVTEPKRRLGTAGGLEELRARAATLRPGLSALAEHGFILDDAIDLRSEHGLGVEYEQGTVAHRLYETGTLPSDDELLADLAALLEAYEDFVSETRSVVNTNNSPMVMPPSSPPAELAAYVKARGFVFEPWQLGTYIAALRTKPFVILAGVTGTGKSSLPRLVAEATGGRSKLIPVRPDWTDSSEILGYTDLRGGFRPGALLSLAKEAQADPARHYVCIIDEMNLARVEHYFAETLSRMEERLPAPGGGYTSGPLLSLSLEAGDAVSWGQMGLPRNLAVVGTVNMDESAHTFSRKVLDRAFTLELSDVDLFSWSVAADTAPPIPSSWPLERWFPRATRISELAPPEEAERAVIQEAINTLQTLNEILREAQLQVGYRTRDEVALFLLHTRNVRELFFDGAGQDVSPLDVVVLLKILPRIFGGSAAIRRVLSGLLAWAQWSQSTAEDDAIRTLVDGWVEDGRPGRVDGAQFPRTAARLCLMWERLQNEGFTSYWL